MRRAALFLVLLFLFACDREPVAPDITPSFGADRAVITVSQVEDYSQYVSAIGEVVHWSGPFSLALEILTTPSGNEMWRLVEWTYLEGYQGVGEMSGDVWIPLEPRVGNAESGAVGTVHFLGDGLVQSWTWHDAYVNQDGDRLFCQSSKRIVLMNGELRVIRGGEDHCRLE